MDVFLPVVASEALHSCELEADSQVGGDFVGTERIHHAPALQLFTSTTALHLKPDTGCKCNIKKTKLGVQQNQKGNSIFHERGARGGETGTHESCTKR